MKILETERLILREIVESDSDFILNLLNQPSFIKNIGDRNVRSIEQAREYIASRFAASYQNFGYGFWAVELKHEHTPIGICGFVKRDFLPEADIGFAFPPEFQRKGYAFESARAALEYGREKLDMKRVSAITSPDNFASGKLLEKLGFVFEKLVKLPNDAETVKLFVSEISE